MSSCQVRSDELWRWYDILCPLSDSGPGGCRVHNFFVIYDRGVVRNLTSPEGFAAMIRWVVGGDQVHWDNRLSFDFRFV
jgi:hypothetical protein